MVGGSEFLRASARWLPAAALRPFGRPVALLFHGVEHSLSDPRIEKSHHAVAQFREIAKYLKTRFQVLPLAALSDVLARPERHERTVFLMSDDGYRNVAATAADILDAFGLPWTLFVSTHHIGTGAPNPLTLARLFLYFAPSGSYAIPHLHAPIVLTADRGRIVAQVIGELMSLEYLHACEAMSAMADVFLPDRLAELVGQFPSERFLTWPEVRALHDRGVEIGAHGHWHWPMNCAQRVEHLREQTRLPKLLIERHVGPCAYFAYPFGNVSDVSPRAWREVREAGYACAFTTLSASLDAGANRWLLPRYTLRPTEPSLAALTPLLRAGNARLSHWQRRLAS